MDRRLLFLVRQGLALALIGVVCVATASSGSKSHSRLSPESPEQNSPGPPAAGGPPAAAPRSASVEGIAAHITLDELGHIREEITLGTWKTLHNTDSLELYSPKLASYPNESWCARMVSEVPLDSDRKVKRTAYFYLPAEPNPPALPSNFSREELVSQCRLGFVWSEVEDADSMRAEAFADAVRQSIKTDLGPGEMDLKLQWAGSSNWRKTAFWETGRLEVASAATFGPGPASRSLATIVGAAGEISGIRFRSVVDVRIVVGRREKYVAQHQPIWSRIEEALSIAGLGGPAETSFRAALKLVIAADGWWSRLPTDSEQSAIFDAVDQWLIASSPLAPARRSAALFAADQLFQESRGPRWREGESPPIRQRLEAWGAHFEWLHIGDSYFYTHTWLREAFAARS